MASISKRVSSSWVSGDERVMKTATDTITTLPVDIYTDGTNATVGLVGNMLQSGTPTPENPIMPQGTGERTANLCSNIPYKRNYYINENGVETSYNGFDIYKVSAIAGTAYTLSLNTSLSGSQVRIHSYSNGSWIEQTAIVNAQSLPATFTTPNNCDEIRFSINYVALDHIMLNTGSQPLPYQPYGYVLPIKSANTTTPIYLGEVETTRRVKKLVFDGTEKWQLYNRIASVGGKFFNLSIATQERTEFGKALCSHYTIGNPYDRLTACCVTVNYSLGIDIRVNNPSTDGNIADFKTYLQQQYAAGTPVTVWYVLATEETGIVNEPLRKIGDYADTVSGVSIPTTTGKDTFDVLTTLKPSEVSLAYTGWHDATFKEWDGSEWD